MRFRTEIESIKAGLELGHADKMVLLGSCFTDEVGSRLAADGFDVCANPFGALYNPMSICRCIDRILSGEAYSEADLTSGPRGYHCLDYATRYSGADIAALLGVLNDDASRLRESLCAGPTVFLTFGTAYVYRLRKGGRVVGNCHKFPAGEFDRRLLSVDEIVAAVSDSLHRMREAGVRRVVFTVSPIRHVADGLHGNTVSKAVLHLAVERLCAEWGSFVSYFPAYEMMIDDLRDYRFYAADMKHPSDVAVDYIYEFFSNTYFNADTRREAVEYRRQYKASLHRPIL